MESGLIPNRNHRSETLYPPYKEALALAEQLTGSINHDNEPTAERIHVEGTRLYILVSQAVLAKDAQTAESRLATFCIALGRHLSEAVAYIPAAPGTTLPQRFLTLASLLVTTLQLQPAFAQYLLPRVLDAISAWIRSHHENPDVDLRDLRMAAITALHANLRDDTLGAELLVPLINMVWYTHRIRRDLSLTEDLETAIKRLHLVHPVRLPFLAHYQIAVLFEDQMSTGPPSVEGPVRQPRGIYLPLNMPITLPFSRLFRKTSSFRRSDVTSANDTSGDPTDYKTTNSESIFSKGGATSSNIHYEFEIPKPEFTASSTWLDTSRKEWILEFTCTHESRLVIYQIRVQLLESGTVLTTHLEVKDSAATQPPLKQNLKRSGSEEEAYIAETIVLALGTHLQSMKLPDPVRMSRHFDWFRELGLQRELVNLIRVFVPNQWQKEKEGKAGQS